METMTLDRLDERPMEWTRRAGTLVGASQVLFGVALLLAPDITARSFGVRIERPWVRWFGRLYGIRDVATGLGLWHAARNPRQARPWLAMEALIQSVDAAATAFAMRSGALPKRAALPILTIAPVWVAMCIAGMAETAEDGDEFAFGVSG